MNSNIYECLLKKNPNREERPVYLCADELNIQEQISLDIKNNVIVGVKDMGPKKPSDSTNPDSEESPPEMRESTRTYQLANHGLALMIKCLQTGAKMPIRYGFTRSSVTAKELKEAVEEIVIYLRECGYIVKAFGCDQATANCQMINELLEESAVIRAEAGEQSPESNYTLLIQLKY